ncbi:calcium uptake protein 1 homolog, mitochondrial [Drosophila innubila]|uniref:calcium uptake protein 1 homolog, mitochondrial n=1 Tax=Drosophila innubila TaxID=198719 RepID=UPI00148D065B|nr:calcium uptake protein 1 homolog, mitochondrial [Drosophila innubila]
MNAMLIHQWNKHRKHTQNCLQMHSHRHRALKICTLLLIAGLGFRQWLLPRVKRSSLMGMDDEKTKDGVKGLQKLEWQQTAGKCRTFPSSSHRGTFRDITIREYENRLRAHSQPEKIFGYFATIKTQNNAGQWEVYMTPIDFLRSMMPGIRQPDGLGLNGYRKMSREKAQELTFRSVPEDSIFYVLLPDGLLTFTDYLYLRMLMPMPEKFFEIGFRLFDPLGSDNLGMDGLSQLLKGVTVYERFKTNNSINHYFFGPKLDGKLNLNTFLKFKRKLVRDVLLIEFNLLRKSDGRKKRNENDPDTISEMSFGNMLLAYSSMPTHQKLATIQRIKEKYRKSDRGVTLEEFMAFFMFVQHIPTIDMALTYHFLAGADISRSTLKHISDIVVGVSLSSHIIDIIFTVFDTDNNDILGRSEFLQAVRHRMARKKRTKVSELFDMVVKCAGRAFLS